MKKKKENNCKTDIQDKEVLSAKGSGQPVESYVAYNEAVLVNDKKNSALYRKQMIEDVRVQALISRLNDWPGPALSSHKSPQQLFHMLAFLADIGITKDDPGVQLILDKILSHRDENGVPQLKMAVSESHGGTGEENWAWALCDAPTILYSLVKMGVKDAGVKKAVQFLSALSKDNGWGCVVSKQLGNWRGPGKKDDPCPYATLIMTKLLIQMGSAYSDKALLGAETLLHLWQTSRTQHPYMFYMGTDFRKLKLPFFWYDILHVAEVISLIPQLRKEPRFQEMIAVIQSKSNAHSSYIPESIYLSWKDWDFAQKKVPSQWMNFCIKRIQARIDTIS